MYKYYYKSEDGNTIEYLGKAKNVPASCVQITKEQYENYKSILKSIEDKEGYVTIITLYIDGTCDIGYIQENAAHKIVEEAG